MNLFGHRITFVQGTWAIFLATAVGAAQAGAQVVNRPDRIHIADSLLANRSYLELDALLQRAETPLRYRYSWYSGVVANRRNRNATAIALLRPLLADRDIAADTAARRLLLTTLGDSYAKRYQYRDASRMIDMLEREFSPFALPEEKERLRRNAQFWRLLVDAPPQVMQVRATELAMRRGVVGVPELPVRIANDSSWWIFDTGANFSTVVESAAARWGLTLSPDTSSVASITGLRVKLRTAVLPLARIGDIEVRNMVVLVVPDSALHIGPISHQITAILGFPVIEAMKVVTVTRDRLVVMRPPTDGAETDLLLEYLTPLVSATVDSRTGLYHLDTGANTTTFSRKFVDAYPELFSGMEASDKDQTGAGGSRSFRVYTLPSLHFSLGAHSTTLRNAEVNAARSTASYENFLGNVGQDAFANATLTLDFQRMRLVLSR